MKLTKLSLALLVATGIGAATTGAQASSHREAPFIAGMPKVDGADFYMFNSYEPGRSGYVTLIADYIPLQDSYGAPNYFTLDPQALYEIHVDNNGDAREDLTFQFRFSNKLQNQTLNIGGKDVATPLVNVGPAVSGVTAGLNVQESYSLTLIKGNRRSDDQAAVTNLADGSATFTKPVDNIGNKTIADYASYAAAHIYNVNIPGCQIPAKLFVGQRKEPFAVNLGEVFDLINLNPIGAPDAESNVIADKNITSLELEVHKSCLTNGTDPVIGAWTTASMRQAQLLLGNPSYEFPTKEKGPWVQVSRLGMPLVNEVVIGLQDKNKFNASRPKDDAQFATYVTNPTLPALIEILYPIAPAPTNFPRNDLVATFLTGITGINQPLKVTPSEMLRINTTTQPTPQGSQSNLGVLGGDLAGFPNGRRPGDDVVDIALRASMGVLCTLNNPATFGCVPTDAVAGGAPFTDGATVSDAEFDNAFPYLVTPIPGSPTI